LEKFIEPSHIIKELGGDEDWEYRYVEPIEGENAKMEDIGTKQSLLEAREALVKEFESATLQWLRQPGGTEGSAIQANRNDLAKQLKENYWTLDPYIRARSLYDRLGNIGADGQVNWYNKAAPTEATGPTTSADDVD
jgi:hypothetical protein